MRILNNRIEKKSRTVLECLKIFNKNFLTSNSAFLERRGVKVTGWGGVKSLAPSTGTAL